MNGRIIYNQVTALHHRIHNTTQKFRKILSTRANSTSTTPASLSPTVPIKTKILYSYAKYAKKKKVFVFNPSLTRKKDGAV